MRFEKSNLIFTNAILMLKGMSNKMELLELCDKIGLQPQMRLKIKTELLHLPLEELDQLLLDFMDAQKAQETYRFLSEFITQDDEHVKMLICYLICACRTYERYQEMNVSDTIFFDTMKCFPRFIGECEKRTGKLFFDRGWWTWRQVSMRLFRIGELEYEIKEFEELPAIGIHIPSDADFSKEQVNKSLEMAKQFFKEHYPKYDSCKYICHSWLLAPELRELLGKDSNILQFQNRFELISIDSLEKEFFEWLFQVPVETDYQILPENTSLQKKVKQRLLKGERISSGFGVLVE